MKVLKTPEEMAPKVEWTKTIVCRNCGALLEYNNLDVKQRLVGPNEIGDILICGHCNKWFELI